MKNIKMKSKNKKAKGSTRDTENKKSVNAQSEHKRQNFYYMAPSEIRAYDIFEVINKNKQFATYTEFWDMAEVLEITTGDKTSIDIEKDSLKNFKDEEDSRFINENNIKSIFFIQLEEGDMDKLREIFTEVVSSIGGFVCSDTQDFMPYIIK